MTPKIHKTVRNIIKISSFGLTVVLRRCYRCRLCTWVHRLRGLQRDDVGSRSCTTAISSIADVRSSPQQYHAKAVARLLHFPSRVRTITRLIQYLWLLVIACLWRYSSTRHSGEF